MHVKIGVWVEVFSGVVDKRPVVAEIYFDGTDMSYRIRTTQLDDDRGELYQVDSATAFPVMIEKNDEIILEGSNLQELGKELADCGFSRQAIDQICREIQSASRF